MQRAEVLAEQALGSDESILVRTYGIDEGLPSLVVEALECGPDGTLWVGTAGGLCRFDGVGFERLRGSERGEFAGGRIVALHRDARDRMWIGTQEEGVFVHAGGRFRRVLAPAEIQNPSRITSTPDGAVWIAGRGAAVVVGDAVRRLDLGPSGRGPGPLVSCLGVLDDGRVRIDSANGTFTGTVDGLGEATGEAVNSRFTDPAGRPCERRPGQGWVDSATGELLHVQPPFGLVVDQIVRRDGAVAVAAQHGFYVVTGTGASMRIEEPEGATRTRRFLSVGGGNHFIATHGDGLISITSQPYSIARLGDEPARPVSSVVVDRDGLAFAASIAQRRTWIGDGRSWAAFDAADRAVVRGAVRRGDGGFFVLQRDGLYVQSRGERDAIGPIPGRPDSSAPPAAPIAPALFEAPRGGAWLWARGALYEFGPDGRVLRTLAEPSAPPAATLLDAGATYFLIDGAVHRLGPDDSRLEMLFTVPAASLRAALLDDRGALWITTYGDGLFRRRTDGTLDHWTERDGIVDDFLGWIGIARDAEGVERLWINSNSGVIAIERSSLDAALGSSAATVDAWRLGTPESNGAGGAVTPGGALLVPSLGGLVRVDPARAAPPPRLRVVVDRVAVEGEVVERADTVAGASLEVRFSGVSLPSAEGSRFQYRLRGLEDEWVRAGESRVARYPNLDAGDYVFEVRGRLPDGEWSAPVLALGGAPIHVAKHWHHRRSVQTAAMVGVVLAILGGIRFRTRALWRRTAWMEGEIERRRRVEEDLARNEERFRTLFRTIPTPVLVFDESLELLDWNDSAASSLGLADAHGRSRHLRDIVVGGAEGNEFLRVAEAASKRVERTLARCIVRDRDGRERRFRWALGPVRESDGRPRAVMALGADVTDEERNAAHLDQLRRQVVHAEEIERGRIARELHDDLSQRLAALAMDLVRVGRRGRARDDVDADTLLTLSSVEGGIREVARDVHSLSRQLHPTVLDDLGLAKALASEAERRARQHQVEIRVDDRMDGARPDRDVALTFFRVAQEALQNACKHAGASTIDVRLSGEAPGTLSLVVEDDGVGFDATNASQRSESGLGLASMGERARLVGGTLRVDSEPGRGTRVELTARV